MKCVALVQSAKSQSERSGTDEPPAAAAGGGGAMAELRRGLLDLQPQASDEVRPRTWKHTHT
jgi:hypothetical protein